MTASTLRLISPIRRRMSCCDSLCHSRCNAASNWRMFCRGGTRAWLRRPSMSQICAMGFKSGSWLAKEQKSRLCFGDRRLLLLNDEAWRCHPYTQALSLVGGYRIGGQQLLARRLWCTDYQLGCLVWWLNPACSHERCTPKTLLSLHRKGQLAGCSLGYRLYFCVLKPSSGRRLHEAETGSRLTNGSCAMSINSNHVVLSTMPNVIVDIGLPTVDV